MSANPIHDVLIDGFWHSIAQLVLIKLGKWPKTYLPPKLTTGAMTGPEVVVGSSAGRGPATEDGRKKVRIFQTVPEGVVRVEIGDDVIEVGEMWDENERDVEVYLKKNGKTIARMKSGETPWFLWEDELRENVMKYGADAVAIDIVRWFEHPFEEIVRDIKGDE